MEGLFGSFEVIIPLKQLTLLICINMFFVLMSMLKSALLANFIFTFYWVCQAGKAFAGPFSFSKLVPLISNYTVVGGTILIGITLMIFYELCD